MADFNHWNKAADAFPDITAKIVSDTATAARKNIRKQIRANGQIDTGNMYNGIYTVTADNSTYQSGKRYLPEVPRPEDNQSAYVASAADYSVYQNYGTRYMAGRAFWEPGLEQTQADFERNLKKIPQALEDAAK